MVIIWLGFIGFVIFMLALDLGVFHRHAHVVTVREALIWSAIWILLGLLFAVFVYYGYEYHWLNLGSAVDPVDDSINDGKSATLKYLTGYIVEKSLSVDNVFVIALIFAAFAVPSLYQHRVLFWGVLGALVMRGLMIAIGARLVADFHWILYIFGIFLIVTAVKMLVMKTEHADPNQNPVVRLTRRLIPVTERYHGSHFLVRAGSTAAMESEIPGTPLQPDRILQQAKPGTYLLTPLALALILVEFTDLIFAVDSIPAIFAITADPFLVFTSNVFAILGLRSLYFALADLIDRFIYLKVALSLVLLVVGIKMLMATWLKAILGSYFNFYLLGVVAVIIISGIVISLVATRKST